MATKAGAGVDETPSAGHRAAVGGPQEGFAVVVLQENAGAVGLPTQIGAGRAIGATVARDVPARPGVAETAAADHAGPVQFPDDDLAAAVLKPDIGPAVTIEIAGTDGMPARPGIAETAAADHTGP